jgi:tagatose 1,6-diphosphate aldolase
MVRPADRGHKYAAKACRMLFPFAKDHDLKLLHIITEASNTPSARTCELIGEG